jgi:hypothetical protein
MFTIITVRAILSVRRAQRQEEGGGRLKRVVCSRSNATVSGAFPRSGFTTSSVFGELLQKNNSLHVKNNHRVIMDTDAIQRYDSRSTVTSTRELEQSSNGTRCSLLRFLGVALFGQCTCIQCTTFSAISIQHSKPRTTTSNNLCFFVQFFGMSQASSLVSAFADVCPSLQCRW